MQEQIYNALCYLGESEPEEILHSCDEYLRQHDKVGPLGLGVSALPCQGGDLGSGGGGGGLRGCSRWWRCRGGSRRSRGCPWGADRSVPCSSPIRTASSS